MLSLILLRFPRQRTAVNRHVVLNIILEGSLFLLSEQHSLFAHSGKCADTKVLDVLSMKVLLLNPTWIQVLHISSPSSSSPTSFFLPLLWFALLTCLRIKPKQLRNPVGGQRKLRRDLSWPISEADANPGRERATRRSIGENGLR